MTGGVYAAGEQPGLGVVPFGAPAQCVDVGQQAAFGIALEVFFAVVRVADGGELADLVAVAGDVARRVGELDHLAALVVGPGAGLARAVHVAGELAVGVVLELLGLAAGIGDADGQAHQVVGILGLVTQRVDRLREPAARVVVAQPEASLGVADLDELVLRIPRVVHYRAIGPDVFEQVADLVVGVAVVAAIGVDMADDILGIVAEEPLGAFVRVDDAVGIAKDVAVVPCPSPCASVT